MMDAEEFRAGAESGEVPIDSHDQVLKIAYIYLDEGLWDGNGVFDVVDQLHARGWSFGQGSLGFNRTLDIFYLSQIAAGIYRSSDQLDGDFPSPDEFDSFYSEHRELLDQDAWRQYYSPKFLAQAAPARFYRLPNLRDLPDSSDPLGKPRNKGVGHFSKLPRWAHAVVRTRQAQPTLPDVTTTQMALSTLQRAISRLREECPSVQPFSETQARFWLKHMGIDSSGPVVKVARRPSEFGILIAQGAFDVWTWEAHYSKERWDSIDESPLEPDLDGTRKSEVAWCGLPDGGLGVQAWWRGWEPELGSEEEIEFLAAVAVKETEGINPSELDYTLQSHILLWVLRAAFETDRDGHVKELRRRIVEAGRLEEGEAESWIRQALLVMEPYSRKVDGWPTAGEEQSELFRQILVENGQLFARWKLSPTCKEFNFELKSSL